MHFGFVLGSWNIDLLDIDLLDTDLDFVSRSLLDTNIPSTHFVYLQDVFKMSQDISSRRLQGAFKTSSA